MILVPLILLPRPEPPPSPLPWHRRLYVLGGVVLLAALAFASWRASGPDSRTSEEILKQAQADLDAAAQDPTRLDRVAEALASLGRKRAPTAEDHVLAGQLAAARDQVDEAIAEFRAVPDAHALGPHLRAREGQLELRRGRVAAAERALVRALELDPAHLQARRELIYIYGYQLRRRPLREQYRELSRLGGVGEHDAFLWCLLRDATWEAREAVETLRGWVAADPTDRASRLGLAENLRQMGRPDEALVAISGLLDHDDDARELAARIALDAGDLPRVDALLDAGSLEHPGLSRLRGKRALTRGDAPAAARWFRQALQADPEQREAVIGLAQVLRVLDDPEAEAYRTKAARLERFSTRMQAYTEARNRGTLGPTIFKEMSAACEELGRRDEAIAWLRVALERDPLDRDAQSALFRLRGS